LTLHIEVQDLLKVLDKAADQEKVFEAAMQMYAMLRWGRYDNIPNAQFKLSQEAEKYLDKWYSLQGQEDYLDNLTGNHD
jgi:hypothetical protein